MCFLKTSGTFYMAAFNPVEISNNRSTFTQLLRLTCGETSCRGHSQFCIRVLVHGNNGKLPVFSWPLHHSVIFTAAEVHCNANIVWVVIASSIWIYTDAKRVALWVEEASTFDWAVPCSGVKNICEVWDPPDSAGASAFRQSDVIDWDGAWGTSRSSDTLEEITELVFLL